MKEFEHLATCTALAVIENIKDNVSGVDINAIGTFLEFIGMSKDILDAQAAYFTSYGLSTGKFGLLMNLYLSDDDGLSPYELAEKANVTRGTVTTLLDGLEKLNYVTRDSHPDDRRMLVVRLTEIGRDFLKNMLPDHFRRTEAIMKNLSLEERNQLIMLVGKVRAGVSEIRT